MKLYNHACDVNFEVLSDDFYGKDVTGAMVRSALQKYLEERTDDQLLVDLNIYDTIKVDAS